ncbi:NADH-quinone oxidoreductase subunit J [Tepidibacillus infernus]|uniref:NADH-quinone oxidoreductase subunit J n=1 Tax=Tepidibacillus decaturensis TaxID=1413211 RepID=A0A135L745_9BACI|nr:MULTISPECIES: NADH-quinone oxidoreductase subunit J [Tepidibacillus]KXG44643.1 NADH:ubiquinone oxidoreductase subunit J [Tepidibacillus decaturensis]GBF11825.1 NADH-quinone oxidoreductase subunit J [Tepidibacillus sp. HK-1]
MTGQYIAFFLFALMAISGGVFMLNLNKVVHMVLSIGLSFMGVAGLFILLKAEYLAFVQVLIYAGAITIMMVMGTMMTQHKDEGVKIKRKWHTALSILSTIMVGGFFLYGIFITNKYWPTETSDLGANNVMAIGETVFTKYVIPFELASVLLLVALVGAIVLAKKESEE